VANERNNAFLSLFQPGAEFRDAALAYASYQLFVHPLHPGEKKPLVKAWQRHATTDFDQIREWWTEGSENNIGIYLPPSCIVVIDVDPRNSGNETFDRLVSAHGELPPTYTVKTAGEGRHYYFRVTPEFYDSGIHYPNKLGDGVDFLINRYVVAPPSSLNSGGEYTVASVSLAHDRPIFTELPLKWVDSAIRDFKPKFGTKEPWPESFAHGERNDGAASIAGAFRRYGCTAEEIESVLHVFGQHGRFADYDTDLEFKEELSNVARSIAKNPPEFSSFKEVSVKPRTKHPPEIDTLEPAMIGPFGEFVRYIEPITEAHPAALLCQSLAVFGNMIGGKTQNDPGPGFYVEDGHHKTALYVMLVGESAQAAKGDSWSRVHNLFKHVDPSHSIRSGVQTGEAVIDMLADADLTVNDEHTRNGVTAVDKRCLLYQSEFVRMLHVSKRQGSILKDIFREVWDTGATESIAKSSQQRVTNATLSIIGHITKDDLEHDLEQVDLENGFANRFLYVHSERTKYLSSARSLTTREIHFLTEPFIEALEFSQNLTEMECPPHYRFTSEAKELWNEIGERLFKAGKKPTKSIEDKMAARARPMMRRIAIIYAIAEHSQEIELHHMEAAHAVWKYSVDTVRYVFGDSIGDPDANRIYRALLANPAGLTTTEITTKVFGNNIGKERKNRALSILAERGLIIKQRVKEGRKPKDYYIARPQ
jgi:Bifunctional DNA primase/polymerase, N-terminal/Protein of unknown function (DUF3987)/Primase C terminal 1 (PriCT-1)